MSVNLETLSREELLQLQIDVVQALKDLEVRQREEAREAAENAAKKFGFTLAELTGQKRGKGKGSKPGNPAKYANPDNADEPWSGRGRQPAWYKAALETGKTPEELAI